MEMCREKDKGHSTSTAFSQYKTVYSYLIVPGIGMSVKRKESQSYDEIGLL